MILEFIDHLRKEIYKMSTGLTEFDIGELFAKDMNVNGTKAGEKLDVREL